MKDTFTIAFTALLLLIATAFGTTAAPTAESTNDNKLFSFASWVDDLASPDVIALTPEQALEAYSVSRSSTGSKRDGVGAGTVGKRAPGASVCWYASFNHVTTIADAVGMIAQLVAKGQQQVPKQPWSSEFTIDVYGKLYVDAKCGGTGGYLTYDRCPGRPII